MNKQQKSRIRETVLRCREKLEQDITNRLINYGIYPEREPVSVEKLKHLDDNGITIRLDLDIAISKEQKAGLSFSEAVANYVKEVSFTYLNRFAALRALEARKIIPEVLVKQKKYGNKSLGHRNWSEVVGELCTGEPDEGITAFLGCIFDEISEEVKILFDTSDEYSLLFPSYAVLTDVIQLLVQGIDEELWKEDEIIGWIYQHFNEKEKDAIFEKLFKENKKIAGKDIAVVTQLFTPKWVVEWIVRNSLGLEWQEIKDGKKPKKLVSDIKLLDPACGSGHFLLQAFDYFVKMYDEEGIVPSKDIPLTILKNNLYGIDVDLRAIQLSALALYIKVKTLNKNLSVKEINLVCADAILLNGEKRKELLKRNQNKILKELIDRIWLRFQNLREYGSLLRVEMEIHSIIEMEKKGVHPSQSYLVEWSALEESLLEQLRGMAKEYLLTNDISGQLFTNEAEKSVHLLDFFLRRYDVVVTNPPYLGRKSMTKDTINFLKTFYPESGADFYSAFIERGIDFLEPNGILGMITQQSFMFLTHFEKLRNIILSKCSPYRFLHLGPGVFEEITGEKVNSVAFVLQKGNKKMPLTFLRLLDSQNKEESLRQLEAGNMSQCKYEINNPQIFNSIPGKPFVYWLSDEYLKLFQMYPPFSTVANIRAGISTQDNKRFLRYWWEVPYHGINRRWFGYAKGGGYNKWWGNLQIMIDWEDNGAEIRRLAKERYGSSSKRVYNEEYFFKEGITYNKVGVGKFSARYLPAEYIFDVGGPCIFSSNDLLHYLLGFVNSRLFLLLLKVFSPTVNFESGNLKKVPYKTPSAELRTKVEKAVRKSIQNKRKLTSDDELSKEFRNPSILDNITGSSSLTQACQETIKERIRLESEILVSEALINSLIEDDYNLSVSAKKQLTEELGESPGSLPVLEEYFDLSKYDPYLTTFLSERKKLSVDSVEKFIKHSQEITKSQKSLEDISLELGLNPISFLMIKSKFELFTTDEIRREIENLLSYAIRCVFGCSQDCRIKTDLDGIIPYDNIFENNLDVSIRNALTILLGEPSYDKYEREIETILEKKLEDWFRTDFFKLHYKKYRKRPVIWHIKSNKGFCQFLIYYHKLSSQTLHSIRGLFIPRKINDVKERLGSALEELTNARRNFDKQAERLSSRKVAELQDELEDIEDFDKDLKEIIESGYKPDLDKGVYANLKPLEKLVPIKVR